MKMCQSVLVLWLLFLSITMSLFNVSMLNMNGARETSKRSLLYKLVNLKKIDVMFLQEMHSDTSYRVYLNPLVIEIISKISSLKYLLLKTY